MRSAYLAALFFVLFEGTFWMWGAPAYRLLDAGARTGVFAVGEFIVGLIFCIISVLFFALFIKYAGKECRGEQ